jgi:DNA replication and repair protein RecF
MALVSLEVTDFRCIERAHLELDSKCTLITGENASGKTSLLEAIHVLSCGHSFRSNHQELLIREGADCFRTVGRVATDRGSTILGVQGSRTSTTAHVAGQVSKGFADLAIHLPTQVIDPEIHRLLEDGPKGRRRFMDWGVFHVERQFVDAWRRYQRALKQRNAALKAKMPPSSVQAWDLELIGAGKTVSEQRHHYVDAIRPIITDVAGSLLGLSVTVEHRPGWNPEYELGKALEEAWARDQRYGLTTVGPHRADLVVLVEGALPKERISRGQQKLLASALILAQIAFRSGTDGRSTCLLLDDPAAELDVDNLKRLLQEVANVSAQLVVTSLDLRTIDQYLNGAVFHVKQGNVAAVL